MKGSKSKSLYNKAAVTLLAGAALLFAGSFHTEGSAQGRSDINKIRRQFDKDRRAILGQFREFQNEVRKSRPGINLALPISPRYARKMRMLEHNALPGQRGLGQTFAFAAKDYRLRSVPSEDDATARTAELKANEKVEVVLMYRGPLPDQKDRSFRWCLVRVSSGRMGYIPNTFLRNSAEEPVKPKPPVVQPPVVKPEPIKPVRPEPPKGPEVVDGKNEKKYVTSYSGLRMRHIPALDGDKIATLPYRAEVVVKQYTKKKETIYNVTDSWAQVEYAGDTGWVFNAYLRPIARKEEPVIKSDKPFVMPITVDGRRKIVTSEFGRRVDPVTGRTGTMHKGIDIAAPRGTPIRAAGAGKVVYRRYNRWYGYYIILDHGKDKSGEIMYTYYCHQLRFRDKWRARLGSRVRKGQVIGYVGKTGKATGHHLHFEVRFGRDARNPRKFLPF